MPNSGQPLQMHGLRSFAVLRQLFAEFKRRQDGQIAVFFALTLVPVMVGVGAAIDYARANTAKVRIQAALDAAVLAGAKDGTTNGSTIASNVFNANLVAHGATVGTPSLTRSGST